MVREFNMAVAEGFIALFGRPSLELPFQRISKDTWKLFEVLNWELGIVSSPAGSSFSSVHAEPPREKSEYTRGRPQKFELEEIWPRILKTFETRMGLPMKGNEIGWQYRADLEKEIVNLCSRQFGEEPGKTQRAEIAKRMIAEYKRGNRSKTFGAQL